MTQEELASNYRKYRGSVIGTGAGEDPAPAPGGAPTTTTVDPWQTASYWDRIVDTPTTGPGYDAVATHRSGPLNFLTIDEALKRQEIMDKTPMASSPFGRPGGLYHDAPFTTWFNRVFPTAPALTGTPLQQTQAATSWLQNYRLANPAMSPKDQGAPMSFSFMGSQQTDPLNKLIELIANRGQSAVAPSRRVGTPDVGGAPPPDFTKFLDHVWFSPTGNMFAGPGSTGYPETFYDVYNSPFDPNRIGDPTTVEVPGSNAPPPEGATGVGTMGAPSLGPSSFFPPTQSFVGGFPTGGGGATRTSGESHMQGAERAVPGQTGFSTLNTGKRGASANTASKARRSNAGFTGV